MTQAFKHKDPNFPFLALIAYALMHLVYFHMAEVLTLASLVNTGIECQLYLFKCLVFHFLNIFISDALNGRDLH